MMNRTLFILLAVCSLATAMVPRRGRALNLEEQESPQQSSTSDQMIEYCDPRTPCLWSIYNIHTKNIVMNITNTYCECKPGHSCQMHIDDKPTVTYVYRCIDAGN